MDIFRRSLSLAGYTVAYLQAVATLVPMPSASHHCGWAIYRYWQPAWQYVHFLYILYISVSSEADILE